MNFAQKLQKRRKEVGFSQEQLAFELNVSRQAVSKWESGQGYPEVEKLIQLSELLGISLDELMKETREHPSAPIKPLDEEQSKAFLKAIQGHRFENLFTVTLFTGMREGEVLGLMWSCVDFEKGTILIDKQLQQEKKRGGQYVFAPLKNDKARTITPAPWVMDLLKHHRAQQAELRLRAGPMWEDSGLVFTNELGHHLARCTLVNAFKAVVTSIGRPDARFHDLRHSYAVAAIRSGDDIKTVQGNLGHATAAFTLDVYGHVTDQMKRESAARMESYIKDVLNL